MEQLKAQHLRLISHTDTSYRRSLMEAINWEARLIGLRGARGVGKTTLLLQHIKMNYGADSNAALYVSMDHLYFASHTLLDLAEQFYQQGGKCLYLDEVHKYEGWSREVKNIYDGFPDLKVVFTGSSLLNILNAEADLSRRCASYDMAGLSFREYLQLKEGIGVPIIPLASLLADPMAAAEAVLSKCRPLQFFAQYLKTGYYPFFLQEGIDYLTQVQKVVNMILEIELPQLAKVEMGNVRKLRSLLAVVSSGVPYAVDISKMAQAAELNRNTILTYLAHLHRSRLLNLVCSDALSPKRMQKPDKIYMENTNLLYALSLTPVEVGTLRETFFANQMSIGHTLEYARSADFRVDHRYSFEVGGPSKDGKQLSGTLEGYIAADGIEYPMGNMLPLWLFGFQY